MLIRLTPAYGSHLDNRVKVILNRKYNVRLRIVMVNLVENVNICLIVGTLVQTLFFQDVDGGHLGYFGLNGLLASNRCQNNSHSG